MRRLCLLTVLALTVSPAVFAQSYRHGRVRHVEEGVSIQRATETGAGGGHGQPALPPRRPRVDGRQRPRGVPVRRRLPPAPRQRQQARLRRPRRRPGRAHRAAPVVGRPATSISATAATAPSRWRRPAAWSPPATAAWSASTCSPARRASPSTRARPASTAPRPCALRAGERRVRARRRGRRRPDAVRPDRRRRVRGVGRRRGRSSTAQAANRPDTCPKTSRPTRTSSIATARGTTRPRSATSGGPTSPPAGSPTPTAAGSGACSAGRGCRTSRGAGPLALRPLGLHARPGLVLDPGGDVVSGLGLLGGGRRLRRLVPTRLSRSARPRLRPVRRRQSRPRRAPRRDECRGDTVDLRAAG